MKNTLLTLWLAWVAITHTFALVRYDESRIQINGIQLLQDYTDPLMYHYLLQYPPLATKYDGTFNFLCIKYIGGNEQSNEDLFHSLIEVTLSPEVITELEEDLRKKVSGVHITGPVELTQSLNENGSQRSLEVVSSVLSNRGGEVAFTSMMSTGYARLTPGSKAVVAAVLNQKEVTLMWNSLSGSTSDISVNLHTYYEAAIKGYNAVVNATMLAIYKHFSQVLNIQKEYTNYEIRRVADEVSREGALQIEVQDQSQRLSINFLLVNLQKKY